VATGIGEDGDDGGRYRQESGGGLGHRRFEPVLLYVRHNGIKQHWLLVQRGHDDKLILEKF
jgi:hypothetical protein